MIEEASKRRLGSPLQINMHRLHSRRMARVQHFHAQVEQITPLRMAVEDVGLELIDASPKRSSRPPQVARQAARGPIQPKDRNCEFMQVGAPLRLNFGTRAPEHKHSGCKLAPVQQLGQAQRKRFCAAHRATNIQTGDDLQHADHLGAPSKTRQSASAARTSRMAVAICVRTGVGWSRMARARLASSAALTSAIAQQ